MKVVEEIIARIERRRAEVADQSLSGPGGREAFDFGYACGVYGGLKMALEVIADVLDDEDEEEKRL